jgi:hypothetical protein
MRSIPLLAAVAFLCPACVSPEVGEGAAGPALEDAVEDAPAATAAHDAAAEVNTCSAPEEATGEAAEDSTLGAICGGICVVLHTLGCSAALAACLDATVITIGAASIPCTPAIGIACATMLALPATCTALCPF